MNKSIALKLIIKLGNSSVDLFKLKLVRYIFKRLFYYFILNSHSSVILMLIYCGKLNVFLGLFRQIHLVLKSSAEMRAKYSTHTNLFKHLFRHTGVQTYFALYFIEEICIQD
jgi:hypothetical protein